MVLGLVTSFSEYPVLETKLGDPVKVEHIILAWNWVEKFLFEA